jgi:hypothetical protein
VCLKSAQKECQMSRPLHRMSPPRRFAENPLPAGFRSPDAGTNVDRIHRTLESFAGPNSLKNYYRSWARWIREFIEQDDNADYFAFSLNSRLLTIATCVRAIRNACEASTIQLFPTLSRRHPERHPASLSVAVILLPAVSASGRQHLHGWIRIPKAAPHTPTPVPIRVKGVLTHVVAPEALATFVKTLVYDVNAPFRTTPWCSTSFWLDHIDGQVRSTTEGAFRYLLRTADRELRQWNEIEFVPTLVFSRLTDAIERKRAAVPAAQAHELTAPGSP